METIAGYKIKNKRGLGHWDALLEEWFLSIERYSRITDGGAPYWFNERANVGVLAASAWRCGRIALEEFQYEKVDVSNSEDTDEEAIKKWNGRCDLWMRGDRIEEIVEAKFKWLNLCSDKTNENALTCLDQAVKDAANTKGHDEIRAVGVAFLPVYAKVDKVGDIESLEVLISDKVASISKQSVDLVAWCFPFRVRKSVSEKYRNYLPGVILLASAVK
ncbi:hypothetical protein [Vogesella oryzae]|uniref:hypothetical protein n=1 Tax=Vogesella oryzae TaxID=1735285 RepID=UPI001581BE0A|nr:hypothetical protein [Vogesella oryzae]